MQQKRNKMETIKRVRSPLLFFVVAMSVQTMQAQANDDVNGDGKVDEQDIAVILEIMQQTGGVKERAKYYWYVGQENPASIGAVANATVGETFMTPILNKPNNLTITYYSENPMIAKVDANTGEVTLVSAGTTTIIAYTDGNLYPMPGEVSYKLTVSKGSVPLSFTQTSVSVRIDDKEFVLPTLNNPQDVSITYSSSDPAVATVLAFTGDVTLVTAGTTTITATFLGDKSYNGISASYTLTVTASGDITAIEDVHIEIQKAQKILHNGVLYIIRSDGAVLNAQGVRVK